MFSRCTPKSVLATLVTGGARVAAATVTEAVLQDHVHQDQAMLLDVAPTLVVPSLVVVVVLHMLLEINNLPSN